ncbi:AraC family transcriptional regulator [Pseudonocardia aurantiaca]
MDHELSQGPRRVTVGENRFDREMHVHSDPADRYTVSIPMSGTTEVTQRGHAVDADVGRAVVARPDADVDMACGDGFSCYSVTIGKSTVADALEHRLGHSVSAPPELAETLDLRTPAGRAWAQLVRLLYSSPMLRHPVLGAPAEEAVAARLLLAVDHRYRDELDGPVHSWGPGPVRRMVDAIEATPRHPFTLAELSDIAGVSVRTLGACCRRHLDASPGERLRAVRLARAHDELAEGDAGWTTVVAVASGWGFADQHRFTADYGSRYRVPPWLTLRGPAYA